MGTIIHLPSQIRDESKQNKVLPSGWYSQSQEGAHESQHNRLNWEGSNKEDRPETNFTYWHDVRPLTNDEWIY